MLHTINRIIQFSYHKNGLFSMFDDKIIEIALIDSIDENTIETKISVTEFSFTIILTALRPSFFRQMHCQCIKSNATHFFTSDDTSLCA